MKEAILDWSRKHKEAHPEKRENCPMCQDETPIVIGDPDGLRLGEPRTPLQRMRHSEIMRMVKTLTDFPEMFTAAPYIYRPGAPGAVLLAWDEHGDLRLVRQIKAPDGEWPR